MHPDKSLLREALHRRVSTNIKYKSQGEILTNNLMSQEILSSGDTRRDLESNLTFILNQTVDPPALIGGVETVLVDLEPFQSSDGGLRSVCHFRSERDESSVR